MWLFCKWGLAWVLKRTTGKVWSAFVNLLYWMRMLFHRATYWSIKREILRLEEVKELTAIQAELDKFKWRKDTYIDWVPWIRVFLYRGYKDDCDGAARFTEWMFKNAGYQAEKISFLGIATNSHAVCVVKIENTWVLYSNGKGILSDAISRRRLVIRYGQGDNEWGRKFYKRTY